MPLRITTKRLIIRPFTPVDFEAIHAVWSDPEVMRPVPGKAYERRESWARLNAAFSHQARHGFSKWAVVEKASGKVIGECGVHYPGFLWEKELFHKLLSGRDQRYSQPGNGLAGDSGFAGDGWGGARHRSLRRHDLATFTPATGRLPHCPVCQPPGARAGGLVLLVAGADLCCAGGCDEFIDRRTQCSAGGLGLGSGADRRAEGRR